MNSPASSARVPNRRRALWLSLFSAAALFIPPRVGLADAAVPQSAPVAAPAGPEAPPGYGAQIDRAVDEYERGNFEEAREHFRAAHEIFPNARTLRGLGKVEFELRNYGESVKYLQAALGSHVRPLSPELHTEVSELLERARAYVGEVRVEVQPGTATVSVDGVTVASGPAAALELLVGDHVLEFRATGRLSERRHVRVRGRDQLMLQVILAPPDSATLATPITTEYVRKDETPWRKRWWVWTAAGVVVAGAAVAIAVAASAHHDHAGPVLHNP